MSRSATNRRVIYAGNSSTTAFSIPFNFQSNSSYVGAKLYNTSTEVYTSQAITTHYTISGSTLTMLTAPPTGTNLIIYSLVPLSQGVTLTNGVTFLPEDLMLGLDKLNDQIQQVNDKADRAMKWGLNAAIGFDPKMPSSITADATLVGNAAGDGLEFGPTVAEIEGWKDDAEAAAAAAAASQSAAASSASSASTSASAASTSASAAASSAAAAAASAASINGIPSGGTIGQVLTKGSNTNYDASWATPVADHGGLTGLADDDHAGHPWLAGRAGGQSLSGDTASGGNLTLSSTAHATKGKILVGSVNIAIDEANTRVGVGTTSPSTKLHLTASSASETLITLTPTSGTGADIRLESGSVFRIDRGVGSVLVADNGGVNIGGTQTAKWKLQTQGASTQTTASTYLGRDTGDPIIACVNSSTTANNFSGLAFVGNSTASTAVDSAVVGVHEVHTNGSETGHIAIYTRNAGTIARRMKIAADGVITLDGYGAGTLQTNASGVVSAASGSAAVALSTKTADYTVTNSDDVIIVNGSIPITITMHSVASATIKPYRIKNIGSADVTIAMNGGDTVDGDTSLILSAGGAPQAAVELIPNGGTAWYVF